ncbi:hypothetical protein PHLCEN_2v719, partial [Hermanssonia centrifuga]
TRTILISCERSIAAYLLSILVIHRFSCQPCLTDIFHHLGVLIALEVNRIFWIAFLKISLRSVQGVRSSFLKTYSFRSFHCTMPSTTHTDSPSTMQGKDIESSFGRRSDSEFIVTAPPAHLSRTVWWKMDLYILPIATLIFFLSFLDRGNIGNARVAGMQKELNMTNNQYSIALTVTYVPYILIELPSNLLLKRVGPNKLLPAMLTLWGIVTIFQGFITTYAGLVICRFFLGLFEGGLLPGLALYLASFYPRQKLQFRISVFFASSSLAGAFSGLLATAIIRMEGVGGKHGWAWIFILEGVFTVFCGIASFFLMSATPDTASFLTQEEKEFIDFELRRDGVRAQKSSDDEFSWAEVRKAFRQPHMLIMAIAGFLNGTTHERTAIRRVIRLYVSFLPTLPSVPAGLSLHGLVSIITSFLSDLYGRRGWTISFLAVISIVGFGMFLGMFPSILCLVMLAPFTDIMVAGSEDSQVRYGSLFLLLPGTYCAAPPLSAWIANNAAPHVRRATALAFLTTMTNSGGILSTWLLGSLSAAPKYTKASVTFLIFQVGILVCAQLNLGYLMMRNSEKTVIRQSLLDRNEEQGGLGDESAWFEYKL